MQSNLKHCNRNAVRIARKNTIASQQLSFLLMFLVRGAPRSHSGVEIAAQRVQWWNCGPVFRRMKANGFSSGGSRIGIFHMMRRFSRDIRTWCQLKKFGNFQQARCFRLSFVHISVATVEEKSELQPCFFTLHFPYHYFANRLKRKEAIDQKPRHP